jgi:hypothetical protein
MRNLRGVFKSSGEKFYGVTSDVSWDIRRSVQILIKKLITELAWKPRDEFIKAN